MVDGDTTAERETTHEDLPLILLLGFVDGEINRYKQPDGVSLLLILWITFAPYSPFGFLDSEINRCLHFVGSGEKLGNEER